MHIVIVGGGASGFMAAITAAETFPKASITILEKSSTVLNKVRVSGGGRCNVTNRPAEARHFSRNYPRGEKLLKKLLSTFDAENTVKWFSSRGVRLKTEADNRMFPETDSSQTIIECLTRTARNLGVAVRTGHQVRSFQKLREGPRQFELTLDDTQTILADRLLIASGGYPKASGFEWVREHEHRIIQPVPSLFTFNTPNSYLLPLAGVSVQDAVLKIQGTKHEWRGPLLITHWGFSGPAVLKLSAWGARELEQMNYHFTCRINWIPGMNEQAIREYFLSEKIRSGKQQITTHSRFELPLRLWKSIAHRAEVAEGQRWMDAPHKLLNRMIDLLTNSQFQVSGKTTFKEEFVTCGGVDLDDVNPETLESKKMAGLFFAGEVLDVDGITGGFNFQNAWTTGYVVGKNIGL
jgi:predicted Rossmann fold flavoprotein